jgi:ribosomal protein S18 acetylase RimI-like enzyme
MTVLAGETSRSQPGSPPRPSLTTRVARSIGITRRQEAGRRDGFLIRPAEMRDMTAIIGLIDEAAGWLNKEKGTDQWQRPWPNRHARDQRIRRGIKNGRTWIVEESRGPGLGRGKLVATVSCGRGGNKKLWTARERSEPAVYISRLIVSRRYPGQGIGAALLNWAGLRGRENWGAEWIRLDVWTTNLDLQSFYKRQGFTNIRTYQFDDPWEYPSAALFQKRAQDIVSADAGRFGEVR